MANFREEIGHYRKVALDTNALIYYLEDVPPYQQLVMNLMPLVEDGALSLVVSTIVEMELLVKPVRDGNTEGVAKIEAFLSDQKGLVVLAPGRRAAQQAARLIAQYRLDVPDAIIVATALEAGCDAVVGNDALCAQRVREIPYLYLEEFIQG